MSTNNQPATETKLSPLDEARARYERAWGEYCAWRDDLTRPYEDGAALEAELEEATRLFDEAEGIDEEEVLASSDLETAFDLLLDNYEARYGVAA